MTRDERITGIFVLADGILRFFFFFIPRRPRVCVVVELCCVSSAHGAYCPLLAVCSPRETNFSPCLPRKKETCPSMATDDGLIIRHQPRVVKTYHPRFFSFCIPRRQLLFFFLLLWISAAAASSSSFWRVLAIDRVDLLFFLFRNSRGLRYSKPEWSVQILLHVVVVDRQRLLCRVRLVGQCPPTSPTTFESDVRMHKVVSGSTCCSSSLFIYLLFLHRRNWIIHVKTSATPPGISNLMDGTVASLPDDSVESHHL